MKKIIAAFTLTMLLSGCNFGSGPAETIPDEMEEIQPAETALDDNLFVTLSAEILCLPSNHSEATVEEIEMFAKNILKNADVSEEAFSVYQQTIEADAASKKEISLAILGKMGEFCTIVEGGEEDSEVSEIGEIVELPKMETVSLEISECLDECLQNDKSPSECAEECEENSEAACAKEGEKFSKVFSDTYPEKCCAGLTEWASGMDTRKVENGECVATSMEAGSPVGTCLNCGNGVCENIENICNCIRDCEEFSRECIHENEFCGGIAGFMCCEGLICEYDGDYPDAGGVCK